VLTCCANSKEHLRNANTPRGSRRVTGGIDWASDDHAVAVVDPDGVAVKRCTFEHTGAGLRPLVKALQGADVDASGLDNVPCSRGSRTGSVTSPDRRRPFRPDRSCRLGQPRRGRGVGDVCTGVHRTSRISVSS
jgi:hypothetical protein